MCAILEAAPRFDNALFFAKYTRQGITAGESICSLRACQESKPLSLRLPAQQPRGLPAWGWACNGWLGTSQPLRVCVGNAKRGLLFFGRRDWDTEMHRACPELPKG